MQGPGARRPWQEALRYVPGVYADAYGPDYRLDGCFTIRGAAPVYLS